MPTHLTRHIFRALLANEPIIHRGCLRRRAYSTLRRNPQLWRATSIRNGQQLAPCVQRRTFFNFNVFGRKKREIKDADLDPGIDKMMELVKRQRMKARLPPLEEVVQAFTAFVEAKHKTSQPIEDTQAELLVQSLKYCKEHSDSLSEAVPFPIPKNVLKTTSLALGNSAEGASRYHMDLVKGLYELYSKPGFHEGFKEPLKTYVKYLALNGQAHMARDLVIGFAGPKDAMNGIRSTSDTFIEEEEQDADDAADPVEDTSLATRSIPTRLATSLWSQVLAGFARGSSESDLLQTLDMARKYATLDPITPASAMLTFYLEHGQVQQIRTWFSEYWDLIPGSGRQERTNSQKKALQIHRVLQWCLHNNQLDFGHEVVRKVMSTNPPKPIWDAILVWAAGTGKGVDEIDRMIRVMEDSNTQLGKKMLPRIADVVTINALVEFAVSKGDPYMAERFIALGRDRGITPDARTYVLQMEYRLRVKDVDGALVAYKNLQTIDLSSNEDLPTVNKLIVALCLSQRHDFDTIMNVAADLSDREARFEPETVSTLSILHLNRDEFDDVVDLLNTHAYHFSSTERDSIRDSIFNLCIDPKTPTSRSWDAFTLIRKIFDETARSQRTEIMLNFFRRERSDMAIYAFNEMRTHSREDTIPTVDTYVAAFVAAAKLRDIESLEVIHNQLKLDYNITVTTYLNNALILAYTACGKPRKALDFWDDIVASKEGPTYNSIHIALRACEKSPFGDIKAQELWGKLRKMKVELDQGLWASYVAALVGNGDNQLAFSTVEEAEKQDEVEVDAFLIGSLFAGGAGQSKQKEIEDWALARYPHIWEELLNIGIDEDEAHMRAFRIDRSVTP